MIYYVSYPGIIYTNHENISYGGSGYKGSVLIPKLLKDGHEIISIDTNWFGDNLKENSSLKKLKEI